MKFNVESTESCFGIKFTENKHTCISLESKKKTNSECSFLALNAISNNIYILNLLASYTDVSNVNELIGLS